MEEQRETLKKELPHLYGYKWYEWAWKFFQSRNRMNLLVAANQISKDLDVLTLIPTPSGFVRMGDLRVGDIVFAQDGTQTRVVDIPYRGFGPCYEVTFSDGASVIAGPNHEWVCKTSRERFRKEYTSSNEVSPNSTYGSWVTLTTKEIIDSGGYSPFAVSNWRKVSIPVCSPVDSAKVDLPLDPYLLGLLLGDGCFRGKGYTFTKGAEDEEIVSFVLGLGFKRTPDTISYRVPQEIRDILRSFGLGDCLSADKFIPKHYYVSSLDDRLSLLQGLMDTDGTFAQKTKHTSYSTASFMLAIGVRQLVCSLGGTAKIKRRKAGYRNKFGNFVPCQDSYQVSIKLPLNPFRLKRKADKYTSEIRYKHERVIYSIEEVEPRETTCITVEHPSGTFLATEDFIVTHNSSTQIRKAVEWGGNSDLWPELWPGKECRMMWYLYPTKEVFMMEWNTKWCQFMPAEDHPKYGWTKIKEKNEFVGIKFNNGMHLYCRTYGQSVQHLQTGSVGAIFCDEELPEELYDELNMRLAAMGGYFHMVFTATLNQNLWRLAMEGKGDIEKWPEAFKQQISMYDCLKYRDGSPGAFTIERIKQIEQGCKSNTEILRRVYGKFVTEVGRKYPQFNASKHLIAPFKFGNWAIYSAVDIGSGGSGHPPAIVFCALREDRRYGVAFKGWIGDDGQNYTMGNIYEKYLEIKGNLVPVTQRYDQQARDFKTITDRAGDTFIGSNKKHDEGEGTLNTLFKNNMFHIFDVDPLQKLASELTTILKDTPKQKAKDDFADALRYCVVSMPWDWAYILKKKSSTEIEREMSAPITEQEYINMEIEKRRGQFIDPIKKRSLALEDPGWDQLVEEFDEWNERYIF